MMILGVDTGGTFTDFVLFSSQALRTHKVLSTPKAPEQAILQGIQEMGLTGEVSAGNLRIIHGSTVATNAVLESKGAKTALITNRGFKDLLSIGRQTRPHLYHLESSPIPEPVPAELCLEISGRIDANGNILEAIALEDMQALVLQLETLRPEAIAINLLFSFLDKRHEVMLEQYLQQQLSWSPFISRSSYVLPEYKEYERGIATWLNASLGPLVKDYLLKLQSSTRPSPLAVMQSSGGTINAQQAANKAVNLLLSGPAGGLAAASFLARQLELPRLMTFDMGGTSTDVALMTEGKITLGSEGKIASFPVAVPMVDMHTIGAGGGSIAYVDEGGLLNVGPQSAGANPGPACYNHGGAHATVTDANLVLGRLLPETLMGGSLPLSKEAAATAINALAMKLALTIEKSADGIIRVANEHMARALRVISVERGYDPKTFRLCCFGGAGGLHICALAEALDMKRALIPIHAGVLSAMGMFLAPVERLLSTTYQCPLTELKHNELQQIIDGLKTEAIQQIQLELGSESDKKSGKAIPINTEISVDLRYSGQSACLNLPLEIITELAESFHQLHQERYGHRLSIAVELVNIRIAARAKTVEYSLMSLPGKVHGKKSSKPEKMVQLYGYTGLVPAYQRHLLSPGQRIEGPALITEASSTTLVDAKWDALVDDFGNLFLQKL